jgi:hypothetical protein
MSAFGLTAWSDGYTLNKAIPMIDLSWLFAGLYAAFLLGRIVTFFAYDRGARSCRHGFRILWRAVSPQN